MGSVARAYALPAGYVPTPSNPYADPFTAHVVNVDSGGVSRYADMAANSIIWMQGKAYVANAGGIYAVDAETDEGKPIRAMIMSGMTDMESPEDKRVPAIYVGVNGGNTNGVAAGAATGAAGTRSAMFYYAVTSMTGGAHGGRATVGRGLRGRYWQFAVANINGADFSVDDVTITPVRMRRKGV